MLDYEIARVKFAQILNEKLNEDPNARGRIESAMYHTAQWIYEAGLRDGQAITAAPIPVAEADTPRQGGLLVQDARFAASSSQSGIQGPLRVSTPTSQAPGGHLHGLGLFERMGHDVETGTGPDSQDEGSGIDRGRADIEEASHVSEDWAHYTVRLLHLLRELDDALSLRRWRMVVFLAGELEAIGKRLQRFAAKQ